MPGVGFEPTRPEGQRILSPERLPVSPPGRDGSGIYPAIGDAAARGLAKLVGNRRSCGLATDIVGRADDISGRDRGALRAATGSPRLPPRADGGARPARARRRPRRRVPGGSRRRHGHLGPPLAGRDPGAVGRRSLEPRRRQRPAAVAGRRRRTRRPDHRDRRLPASIWAASRPTRRPRTAGSTSAARWASPGRSPSSAACRWCGCGCRPTTRSIPPMPTPASTPGTTQQDGFFQQFDASLTALEARITAGDFDGDPALKARAQAALDAGGSAAERPVRPAGGSAHGRRRSYRPRRARPAPRSRRRSRACRPPTPTSSASAASPPRPCCPPRPRRPRRSSAPWPTRTARSPLGRARR